MKYVRSEAYWWGSTSSATRNRNTAKMRFETIAGRSEIAPYRRMRINISHRRIYRTQIALRYADFGKIPCVHDARAEVECIFLRGLRHNGISPRSHPMKFGQSGIFAPSPISHSSASMFERSCMMFSETAMPNTSTLPLPLRWSMMQGIDGLPGKLNCVARMSHLSCCTGK